MPPDAEDEELSAIRQVIAALTPLQADARERVIQYVFRRLGIEEATPPAVAPVLSPRKTETPTLEPAAPRSTGAHGVDIRVLTEEKTPQSANEMAAIVAYYLAELAPPGDRKTEVAAADIERYFKQANFRLPANARMTLTNAKNAGYLDSGSGRGSYRLNPVGHNLVAHGLPAKDGSQAADPRRKAGRKKKSSLKKRPSRKKGSRKKSGTRR